MGYRELLKKYLCFVETHTGDNFFDAIASSTDQALSRRDLAELRSLSAEMHREAEESPHFTPDPSFNHKLRLLCVCYSLPANDVAKMAGVSVEVVHRWRTSPRSAHYLSMSKEEFRHFERQLIDWRAEMVRANR
jgi:hypothetical protein